MREFEVELGSLPAGICLRSSYEGKTVDVQTRGFLGWEDGEAFYDFLDSFASDALRAIPKGEEVGPENVGSFVVVIRRDRKAKIILQPTAVATIRVSNPKVVKGEAVRERDILDVHTLNFENLEIPDDCGVLLVLSYNWRRCCFFDFGPLIHPHNQVRDFGLPEMFGAAWRRLIFSKLYNLKEHEWDGFTVQGWFPFSALSPTLKSHAVAAVRNNESISRHLPGIRKDILAQLDSFESQWAAKEVLRSHIVFFKKAAEHYRKEDYMSCLSILVPRIEGVMRSVLSSGDARDQKAFARTVAMNVKNPLSALFPLRFQNYLEKVFFAGFDPESPKGFSRNTFSHGVAPADAFTEEAATIGILTLQQVAYCLP